MNKKLSSELDRIRRLAKAYARMERKTVVIVKNNDGTYGFCAEGTENSKPIVEYISQY